MRHAQSANLPWYETEILEPNAEKRETLLELAKMTNNAYVTPDDSQWYELSEKWSTVRRFP
jgi:putative lipase involved disintegration of autophagic bodies